MIFTRHSLSTCSNRLQIGGLLKDKERRWLQAVGGALGEMKEEEEICVSDRNWLLDLCVFVSVSSWHLKAWPSWCTTSPRTTPAIPLCTSSAVDWLLARPLLQFSPLTHYAPALLLRVSQRYGSEFTAWNYHLSQEQFLFLWMWEGWKVHNSLWVSVKEQVLLLGNVCVVAKISSVLLTLAFLIMFCWVCFCLTPDRWSRKEKLSLAG